MGDRKKNGDVLECGCQKDKLVKMPCMRRDERNYV